MEKLVLRSWIRDLKLEPAAFPMTTVDKVDDEILNILNSDNRDRFVKEVAFSRMERGSISPELLSLVVDEEDSELEDEKEVFESLREKSRDRLE